MTDVASVELFSVTYLGLYLARKCKMQQTAKQLPDSKDLLINQMIIKLIRICDHFFDCVNETNSACNGLDKKPFQQTSGNNSVTDVLLSFSIILAFLVSLLSQV